MSNSAKDFDAIIVGARVGAADEMIRFAQMLTPRAAFPSFRFARLMATASRAA